MSKSYLPVSGSQAPVKDAAEGRHPKAGNWKLVTGNFQLNILQTVASSFHDASQE
jgi:hypothetical protein